MKENAKFLTAKDVSELLSISDTSAYRLIKRLNTELEESGYITIPGRVSKKYFDKRLYEVA